ncbi:MAG: hypothetical protein DBX49_00235 [Clostridia bacterium]|nr:V-type ATP synthase subunit E [Bacillota bacterium]PWM20433.1 MAG: hypothetical protein DBX49_00235 [Clostridia bacterium]
MKGTEKIIAHIQADAKAQADAILAQAEQQCASIREDYEKKASAAYGDKIRAGVKECQDKVDSIERIAQMEAKKAVLALKQEMVSASFDKARDMIVGLPKEQYTAFLAKLAAQAAVTGDEEVLLNGRDRDTVGPAAVKAANEMLGAGRLTLAADAGNFAGGLILRRGNIEVNCTVELLVELCRADMSAQLAGVLFD